MTDPTTEQMITELAHAFDIEPTDVSRALAQAREITRARRRAQAPPPPVRPYYKVTWGEREVSELDIIITAADLAGLANPDMEQDADGRYIQPSTDPRLMARIVRDPGQYAMDDRVTEFDYNYGDRAIVDVQRFDFEVTPLTAEAAHEENRTLYRLQCWVCDARVVRRGLRYVHAEQGQFAERGFSPRASDDDRRALLRLHSLGAACQDDWVAEDKSAPPYTVEELATEWAEPREPGEGVLPTPDHDK